MAIVFDVNATLENTILPAHPNRHRLAWDLISSYCLCAPEQRGESVVDVVAPTCHVESSDDDHLAAILEAHDREYVDYLRRREKRSAPYECNSETKKKRALCDDEKAQQPPKLLTRLEEDDAFGLTGDCTPYVGMWTAAIESVRGTLRAVDLVSKGCEPSYWCALHWWGGRHHAKRDQASGFCFLNDVVIGARRMQHNLCQQAPSGAKSSRRPKVVVFDLDAHHGDGTQEAFYYDGAVVTYSCHRFGKGVFPGSGSVSEVGEGAGRGACFNRPLSEGTSGAAAVPLILSDIEAILRRHADVCGAIIVCGADALQGDPLGGLNFDIADMQLLVRCIAEHCRSGRRLSDAPSTTPHCVPLVILGAGGYVDTSFACLSAAVTRDVVDAAHQSAEQEVFCSPLLRHPVVGSTADGGQPALVAVPVECKTFMHYAPYFSMNMLPSALFCCRQREESAEVCAHDSSDDMVDSSEESLDESPGEFGSESSEL